MAHELDMTRGDAHCMVAGEPAWHRLGVNIAEAVDSATAIRLAGLDWEVEQWPLQAIDHETNQLVPVPEHQAMIRSDSRAVLSVMSNSYQPLQNRDAFSFLDALVDHGQMTYQTAGSLKGGRRVWMLAKLPKDVAVTSEDVQRAYVLLSNSHDGSQAIRVQPTSVRVVCNNTLQLAHATGKKSALYFKHVGDLDAKVNQAKALLGIVEQSFDAFREKARFLADVPVTKAEITRFCERLIPDPGDGSDDKYRAQKRRRIAELMDHPANALPSMRGTAWAMVNAATQYVDHEMPTYGKSEIAKAESRLQSMWFGTGANLKDKAVDTALAIAG